MLDSPTTLWFPASQTPASRNAPPWLSSVTVFICDCPTCWRFPMHDYDYEDEDEDDADYAEEYVAYAYNAARESAEGYALVVERFLGEHWSHLDLHVHIGDACRRHRTASVPIIGDEIERLVESLGGEECLRSDDPLRRYGVATWGYVPPDSV